jgi:glycopeptide antibiotics resistance protein
MWAVMLTAWFGLFYFLQSRVLRSLPTHSLKKCILITGYTYPLIETLIKFMIIRDVIPYSWFLLNRIEYTLWALCMTILIFGYFLKDIKQVSLLKHMLLVCGAIIILGNINEYIEYSLRLSLVSKFSAYYPDTIYDLSLNMIGALTGYVMLYKLYVHHDKHTS